MFSRQRAPQPLFEISAYAPFVGCSLRIKVKNKRCTLLAPPGLAAVTKMS